MRCRGELGPPDVRRAIFLLLPRARMRHRGELSPPDVRRAIFFSFFEFASDVAANSAHLMSGGPSFFSFLELACDVAANSAHLMSGGLSFFSRFGRST